MTKILRLILGIHHSIHQAKRNPLPPWESADVLWLPINKTVIVISVKAEPYSDPHNYAITVKCCWTHRRRPSNITIFSLISALNHLNWQDQWLGPYRAVIYIQYVARRYVKEYLQYSVAVNRIEHEQKDGWTIRRARSAKRFATSLADHSI